MPTIKCKHCGRSFTHQSGKFPKKYFKHLKKEHPKAGKKHRGGHPGKKRSGSRSAPTKAELKQLSKNRLQALLILIRELLKLSKKKRRGKKKGKKK